MEKQYMASSEAVSLLALFTMGSTLIIGTGGGIKNDSWIVGLLGLIMAIPMLLIYSRVLVLFPGRDLYSICELALGKVGGKIFSLIYIWYVFHLGALVM